ncbi:hypothetical protein OIU74_016564 [Salix koriyanagi]|uniref:Uncharacterized protein n=1 Tax=Salix koriyanagi TaxID=2511006 RepID=A0A9Q0PGR3_9ROSI|nr:hypothetical protein OIU74_016564 [Salix koriyanagi]
MKMLSEIESLGTSKIDFGVDEIEDDVSDVEDGSMRMTMTMMRTLWLFLMILTRKMVLMRNLEIGQN